jgi:hypothetical protein
MTSQDPITPGARELFDRASARVDAGTALRLRRARQDALQARPRARMSAGLVPAGAFAAAVLALGLAWWMPQRPDVAPTPAVVSAADAEIDGLMAEEDPELYAWLADAPVAIHAQGPQ